MLLKIKVKIFYCFKLLELIKSFDIVTAQVMAEQITYFKFKK